MDVHDLNKMREYGSNRAIQLLASLCSFSRRCIFRVLSTGPIPNHLAFIMDGNRRYAKNRSLKEGAGHTAGFLALMSILNYCYELGVKYITVYAFSIDNFKRRPEEVHSLVDMILEKIQELLKEDSIVKKYGVRVYFIGNLKLLNDPVRATAEKLMRTTSNNTRTVLLVCLAYTSSNEIVNAIQESCRDKQDKIQALSPKKYCNGVTMPGIQVSYHDLPVASQALDGSRDSDSLTEGGKLIEKNDGEILQTLKERYEDESGEVQEPNAIDDANGKTRGFEDVKKQEHPLINMVDIEKHMYMAVAPNPDVLLRSSGETRLSNFLLWQSSNCPLYAPSALWPEIGLWHLIRMVLIFQRNYSYLEKKKKQI
ncbi:dehydrodolichyl diphosphate synthase 6-like [Carica papaya]|uniref:dehydrodolichyl diphosphate synthase 6-like n=1 Tax=Carica papaya TaxID=3649 RepID=UPI000B8CBFD5|nr:dehydrodolichyl diphosphate synthase 6-like [Carica papaya]